MKQVLGVGVQRLRERAFGSQKGAWVVKVISIGGWALAFEVSVARGTVTNGGL